VLTKKGRLKEALAASLKKVRLIEELESELIQQLPWALLDFCELAAVNRAMEERGGFSEQSEDVLLGEEVEDDTAMEDNFKKKAIALAATFGDGSVHRCEKKCLRIATLTSASSSSKTATAGRMLIPNSTSEFSKVM